MDSSTKFCLMAYEEAISNINETRKKVQKNNEDSVAFDELKESMDGIFVGLTERITEKEEQAKNKIMKISAAFENPETNVKLLTAAVTFHKIEAEELRAACESEKQKNEALQKDIIIMEKLHEESKADAAHSLCEICHKLPRDLLLLPCRHFVTCEACGNEMENCSYCDHVIQSRIVVEF